MPGYIEVAYLHFFVRLLDFTQKHRHLIQTGGKIQKFTTSRWIFTIIHSGFLNPWHYTGITLIKTVPETPCTYLEGPESASIEIPPFNLSLQNFQKLFYKVNVVLQCSYLEIILQCKFGSERGIPIIADSGPPRYVRDVTTGYGGQNLSPWLE